MPDEKVSDQSGAQRPARPSTEEHEPFDKTSGGFKETCRLQLVKEKIKLKMFYLMYLKPLFSVVLNFHIKFGYFYIFENFRSNLLVQ